MKPILSATLAMSLLCLGAGGFAEELRDPFVFGSQGDAPAPGAVLIGVLWDASNPLAMVGEETVRVGDLLEGWRVVEIRQDGIMLEQGGRQEFIEPGATIPFN